MECDAAGANIYHIIVCRNSFHSSFFSSFYFHFSAYIYWRVELWQLSTESELTLTFDRVCGLKKKGNYH